METWYGVDRWSTNILTIEVVKTTDQYLFTAPTTYRPKGERTAKRSCYRVWYPTWAQANDAIKARLVSVIARCKSTIRDSSAELETVMNRREQ